MSEVVEIPVPYVDESRCDACGECSRFCAYKAIVSLRSCPLVFPEMCHGCGGCTLVCPRGAISETGFRIGTVDTFEQGRVRLVQGCLDVGRAMAPPLIRRVRKEADPSLPCLIDCPPGTSCSMVAAVKGCDAVILVTEPTPFGLHDLELAADTIVSLGVPAGIVVNKAVPCNHCIDDFSVRRGIPVLIEIPDDRRAAEAYSRGEMLVDRLPGWRSLFDALHERIGRFLVDSRTASDPRPAIGVPHA